MAEPFEEPRKYTVDRLPRVTKQIRELVGRAQRLGIGPSVPGMLSPLASTGRLARHIFSATASDYLSAGLGYYYLIFGNRLNQRGKRVLHEIDFSPIQDRKKPYIYILG